MSSFHWNSDEFCLVSMRTVVRPWMIFWDSGWNKTNFQRILRTLLESNENLKAKWSTNIDLKLWKHQYSYYRCPFGRAGSNVPFWFLQYESAFPFGVSQVTFKAIQGYYAMFYRLAKIGWSNPFQKGQKQFSLLFKGMAVGTLAAWQGGHSTSTDDCPPLDTRLWMRPLQVLFSDCFERVRIYKEIKKCEPAIISICCVETRMFIQ